MFLVFDRNIVEIFCVQRLFNIYIQITRLKSLIENYQILYLIKTNV